MIHKAFLPALFAATLATGAFAADGPLMVKDIQVTADLSAFENTAAAAQWANLEDDLETAIAQDVVGRTSEDGETIFVDITQIEVASMLQTIASSAKTELVGDVKVGTSDEHDKFGEYNLTVSIDGSALTFPKDTDLTELAANSKPFYNNVVQAFSEAVVKRLD
jgi:hypothetical protein